VIEDCRNGTDNQVLLLLVVVVVVVVVVVRVENALFGY